MTIYKGSTLIAGGALPSQSGKSGKYLKTDGSNVSWADVAVPTKTSDLTNDSGFITSSYHDSTKQDKLTAGTGIDITDNVISATGGSAEWGAIGGDIEDQEDLQEELQNVREVAEGKNKSYVVKYADNPAFNSQEPEITISDSFVDINDVTHNVTELKLGDNIFVQETDVPDRWCSNPAQWQVLPEGYTQLEYIQSTGTQYIDTGEHYDSSNVYSVEFQYVEYPSGAKGFFGARESSTAGVGTFDIGCNASNFYFYNNDGGNIPLYARDKDKHIYEEDFTNHITKLDRVPLLPVRKNWTAWQGTQNIYIGRENIAGSPNTEPGTIKIYSCKVSNSGVMVQNFIPAKRDSDDVVGMYDTVSQTFFTNDGTGDFVAGPEVQTNSVTLYKLETAKVPVTDVQINGTTIVNNTVANIPVANQTTLGVAKVGSSSADNGVQILNGMLFTVPANDGRLQAKISGYTVITPGNLDKAIREGLGNNSLTWTDAYKASARNTIGAQEVISDLSTIRSGATAGSTALQPDDNISELTNDAGYITSSYHDNTKQDVLTAGDNIDITDDVISATDTTYSAGNGLTLTGTTFSANVIDSLTSTSTTNALSAKQGKELSTRITNLESLGRYLSEWNCVTGLAMTNPPYDNYPYRTGDYFLVLNVASAGGTNYRPSGDEYVIGQPSTTVETGSVTVGSRYIYDGTVWILQSNTQQTVSFSNIAGQPTDNANLASALGEKADSADLATVATTGSYNDLSNKPTIPTVGDGTITIKQGTATKGTFTTNQSGDTTITLDSGVETDTISITTNTDGEIQTIGVIDQNDATRAVKEWFGTRAEYDAIETKDDDTEYTTTDDSDLSMPILQALYPVGASFITFNETCPLANLFGTWQKVGTRLLVDMNSTVPVVGNGDPIYMGTSDGETVTRVISQNSYGYGLKISGTGAEKQNTYLATDSTKSGMVADLSSAKTEMTINIFRRTA